MVASTTSTEVTAGKYSVQLTNITKPLWKEKGIQKVDYLTYLGKVSDFMLPFLKNRILTTIRYPHGIGDEYFYQKNCPDYAPDYVQTQTIENINYIVCMNLATLLWLGNQAAIEFHLPFSTVTQSTAPSEIVFDLDPPSRSEFELAVEAALILKESFDKLKLTSFIKTSGNKGLQLYIPLPEGKFTYHDTRRFTKFMADFLVQKEPSWFTTERLKKYRGNKLYVDYIQHAEGKTIIAPYSLRGNKEALAAAPLEWQEVTRELRPEQFPMDEIEQRLKSKKCPFSTFFEVKEKQPFGQVLQALVKSNHT